MSQLEKPSEATYLDPACGGGIFSLQLLIQLKEHDPQCDVAVILKQIHFTDIDPCAVHLTRLLMTYTAQEIEVTTDPTSYYKIVCAQSTVGNTLLSEKGVQGNTPLRQKRFCAVVGNPPYGLSRDDQISRNELQLLKKRYAHILHGKPNKYMLFMARGLELTHEKGVVSLVVPNSWLGIESASKLRTHLLKEGKLTEISFFRTPLFTNLSVEAVIYLTKKDAQNRSILLCEFETPLTRPLKRMKVPRSLCLRNQGARIPRRWSSAVGSLLKKITEHTTPLSEIGFFDSKIALQAYAQGKGSPPQTKATVKSHCFHSSDASTESHYPYLEGRDIGRYALGWSGSYLHYGPWLAEPQSLERFQGPRILVREILGRSPYLVQAAYTDQTFLYNKSVLHILPSQECSSHVLLTLLGILNSSIATFILLLHGRKTQRKLFPKLVNGDLKNFPLPANLLSEATHIAPLVKRLLTEQEDTEQDKVIDIAVAEMYGIGRSDYQELKSGITFLQYDR